LVPLLYGDLRRLAHRHSRKARSDQTLQTTALVHELHLHLEKYHQSPFQNRAHFIAVCALVMRQILSRYSATVVRNSRPPLARKSAEVPAMPQVLVGASEERGASGRPAPQPQGSTSLAWDARPGMCCRR
jgi:hypothetical protein